MSPSQTIYVRGNSSVTHLGFNPKQEQDECFHGLYRYKIIHSLSYSLLIIDLS